MRSYDTMKIKKYCYMLNDNYYIIKFPVNLNNETPETIML